MIAAALKTRLKPVVARHRRWQLGLKLAACWTVLAFAGLGFMIVQSQSGWRSALVLPGLAWLGLAVTLVVLLRHARGEPDWRDLARRIEARHPDLNGLLLTAVQQHGNADGQLGYLQERLIFEALAHSQHRRWARAIPGSRVLLAQVSGVLAFGFLATVLWGLRSVEHREGRLAHIFESGITVTPGDTTLERGAGLVVMAQFAGAVPPAVDLVVQPLNAPSRRIPLVKSLSDPMFGGSLAEVTAPLTYRLEYGRKRTGDFQVTVFEYPRLERADAELTYPDYTGRPPKRIENTRRLSAVEGTRLDLALQLNKPVASARFIARDKAGANPPTNLPLTVEPGRAVASLNQFSLTASRTYQLELVDPEGRTNKVPAQFVFHVLKNRRPELRITSPRGDTRPSALEELNFAGTVWDDFGVPAYGLAYLQPGHDPTVVELGHSIAARAKTPFQHLLRLETLGVQPDDLLSWYVWADDIGPDGKIRRTTSDLFFAEVRPFEEIFRQGQQGGQGQQQQQQSQGQSGQGSPTEKLAELQKQIISATWKLQREHGITPVDDSRPTNAPPARYQDDAKVVRDSQSQALEQAQAGAERNRDPRAAAFWQEAAGEMKQALEHLDRAPESPPALAQALPPEQAAYQALLKLQQHEYAVSRNRSRRGQSSNRRGQQMQRQLEQMELTQKENRYETERQAKPPQTARQREQLQVMNRLRELARRQQDLNERLKELQTALQEARTDEERADLQRRLKRLEEEEQQMLADLDELRQRMDRPENQSRMSEQRRRLEQTRNELQRAAESAAQGAASQALASGTRAQRQMQQMREEMRQESASAFAEDLRQMRTDARELAQRQDQIEKQMQALNENRRRTLSDSDERQDVLNRLGRQQERLTNLLDHATQVSQQAEESEPLVSRELYDTLRKFTQNDVASVKNLQQEVLEAGIMTRSLYEKFKDTADQDTARALAMTSEMLRQDYLPLAHQAQQRAREGIGELKRGVERAAEKVLGDDTAALRLARQELDQLTGQLEREIAQADTNRPSGSSPTEQREGQQRGHSTSNANSPSQSAGNGQPRSGQPARAGNASQEQQPNREAGGGRGARPATPAGQSGRQAAARPNEEPSAPAGQSGEPPGSAGRRSPNANQRANAQSPPSGSAPSDQPRQGRAQRGLAQRGGNPQGRGNRDPAGLDAFLGGPDGGGSGPITGEEFAPWSDRLREVEEMVELPELRSGIATARERAQQVRREFKRGLKKPDWAVVRLQVVKPLVEVRNRISEELARREPHDQLVPIDRDPVPVRFSELVRHYYEELGKEK